MVVRCSNPAAFVVLDAVPTVRTGIRVDIYDGNDPNTLLESLTDTWGRRWTDPLRGPGSGEFTVSAGNPKLTPALLAYGNIARFNLDGVDRFAILIEAKTTTVIAPGDDSARAITVTGRGVLAILEHGQTYLTGGTTGDPERVFGVGDINPGELVPPLIAEANNRGSVVGLVSTSSFDAFTDSNNAAWEGALQLTERAGTDLLRIAERVADLAADVYMTPQLSLHVYNQRGVDRSVQLPNAGPVVLQPAANLVDFERSEDGNIINALLIETPGGWAERIDPASIALYGRREGYLSLGNITEAAQLDRAAAAVFERSANPAADQRFRVLDVDDHRPYVDWGPGDWVLAPGEDGTTLERQRVRALTVAETAAGVPTFVPELATVTDELEGRVDRWLKAMVRGTLGGSAGQIAEPVRASAEVQAAVDDATTEAIDQHNILQPHPDVLDDLADVDTAAPADGDALVYSAGLWSPVFMPQALDDLDDVDTAAPADGDALVYSAGAGLWVPGAVAGGGGGAPFSGAVLRKATTQAIPNNTPTTLTFDTEDEDTAGYHNNTNPTRVTAPVTGIYLLSAFVSWDPAGGSYRVIYLRKNGTTLLGGESTGGAESHAVSTVVQLTAGDYVEAYVYHNAGSDRAATAQLSIVKLNGAGGGARSWAVEPGLKPPDVPATGDLEFLEFPNGSDPIADAGLVWGNQGASTAQIRSGRLMIQAPVGNSLRALLKPTPGAGNFTVAARLTVPGIQDYHSASIVLLWGTPAAPTRIEAAGFYTDFGNKRRRVNWTGFNNSWVAQVDRALIDLLDVSSLYSRVVWNGTTLTHYFSLSGVEGTFWNLTPQTLGAGRPDYVGFGVSPSIGSAGVIGWFDFLRFGWDFTDYDPTIHD